jgi:signal transduction histidine kinase
MPQPGKTNDGTQGLEKEQVAPRNTGSELLKVLVVGEAETLEQTTELLDTLLVMGYGFTIMGFIDNGLEEIALLHKMGPTAASSKSLSRLLSLQPPDLLIISSDNPDLRRSLSLLVPENTKILDTFALKIIHTLKRISGQLDVARKRLKSVELIKEVLMSGPETSILVVDEDLRIVEVSDAILRRTKAQRDDCINNECFRVIKNYLAPCDTKGQPCIVRDVLNSGRSVHTVREECIPGENSRYFTVSGYPLQTDEHGKRNVLIVWKDVTNAMGPVFDEQAKHIRENFTHILRQDKMAALGKLASAAVHEINNPIQGILTFAKLMRRGLDKDSLSPTDMEQFKKYLDLIASESARCGKILQNMLSFARKGEIKRTEIYLPALFEEIRLLTGNRLQLQNIELNQNISDEIPCVIGDRDQIKQAFLNLLLNSAEAMPIGGEINLDAKLSEDKKYVSVTVNDSGVGIPEEFQTNIFEPFFSTKDEGKGVGLGLSVVYGIISQHGGSIEVDSVENKGASFYVTLPAKVSDDSENPGDNR